MVYTTNRILLILLTSMKYLTCISASVKGKNTDRLIATTSWSPNGGTLKSIAFEPASSIDEGDVLAHKILFDEADASTSGSHSGKINCAADIIDRDNGNNLNTPNAVVEEAATVSKETDIAPGRGAEETKDEPLDEDIENGSVRNGDGDENCTYSMFID